MKIDSVTYAVASKVVKTFAMSVTRIRGYSNSNGFLHVFDTKAVPAGGTVPKRSYPIYVTAPFDVMLEDAPLDFANGCVMAMSSDPDSYTALVSTMDLFVTGYSATDDTGWTVAGDYTTADEILQVWAEAAGPKKLVRLEASDTASALADCFVQVHASDAPATDKIVASFPLADGTVLDLFFGDGLSVVCSVAGVLYSGCTVAISSTQSTYNAVGDDLTYIRATYK
jgi:hypothetical protein